jgi:excisionase family DNA binding protein
MQSSNNSQTFLSADEVASRLGCSRFEIYRQLKSGELPAPDALVGRTFGWSPETVTALVFERRGVPQPAE